jgi:hypothetical protein
MGVSYEDMLALIDEFDESGHARIRLTGMCHRCHREREMSARNLCTSCYVIEHKNKRIHLWPLTRSTTSLDNVAATARAGLIAGLSLDEIAESLGMTKGSLHTAMYRARRAGLLEATSELLATRDRSIRS